MKIFDKLEPVDIIAVLLLISCLFLKYKGLDGGVTTTVAVIVGYYFGHKRKAENNKIDEQK